MNKFKEGQKVLYQGVFEVEILDVIDRRSLPYYVCDGDIAWCCDENDLEPVE